MNENVSLVISRQILTDFTTRLTKLDDVVAKQIAHFCLEKIHTRVISFEEQVISPLIFFVLNFLKTFQLKSSLFEEQVISLLGFFLIP